jgi:hypothetical protein
VREDRATSRSTNPGAAQGLNEAENTRRCVIRQSAYLNYS